MQKSEELRESGTVPYSDASCTAVSAVFSGVGVFSRGYGKSVRLDTAATSTLLSLLSMCSDWMSMNSSDLKVLASSTKKRPVEVVD